MNFFNRNKSTTAVVENTFDAPTTAVEDITGDYTIDPAHTRLGFSARHAMVTTVRGQFQDFAGTAHIDTANPAASTVELTIQTASIDTGVADRDGHLKSGDFFDAEANPEITFVSTKVERDGDDWVDHRRPDHQGRHQAGHHRASSPPARPATPSATCASASRARPRSTARTGA